LDAGLLAGASDPGNVWLREALGGAMTNPWSMWRAELATAGASAQAASDDSAIARLGEQRAAAWRVALQRLARADRASARRLAIRLGSAIDFGDGVVAPVWTDWPGPLIANDGLGLLLADLLAADLSDSDKTSRARTWIDALPAATAWVIDDAGGAHTALMLVNLSDAPAAASVTLGDAAAPAEMLTIKPLSAARVSVATARLEEEGRRADPVRTLDIRIGSWRGRGTVVGGCVVALPPGVPIGPLQYDVAMGRLATGASSGVYPVVIPAPGARTLGKLMKTGTKGQDAWTIYLECEGTAAAEDEVKIFFGPAGGWAGEKLAAPTRWRIRRGGEAALDRRASPRNPDPDPGVVQIDQDNRWVVWAPVPAAAIEADGTLRIGIVRERRLSDGLVERTAWPRPIAPWHEEPGRIAVDLRAWDGLAGQ